MAENVRGILAPFHYLGCGVFHFINEMGRLVLFLLDALRLVFSSWGQFPKAVRQIFFIGVKSIVVISLIGIFTGMVIGLQMHYALSKFGSEGFLGAAVALSLVRELGPALSAVMIIGRAGSSMTAEIGVMRISDQIDALEVMDINPMSYLVSPKLVASLISFPILTAIFDLIGIFGGYLTGVSLLGGNGGVYWYRVESSLELYDITGGFIKSLVFAVLVCTVCCYEGYYTHRRRGVAGPEGVSQSTTSAVVTSCVLVLVSDYVLTALLF
ncbi:MAG: MlaE family ABC transporter permease [Desulfovibrio sp.]